MVFDEKDLELHAEYIIITDGGSLTVGTEDEPFQHEATIMLHGHVRTQELPIFGAKVLAVRNGTLDLHGKVHSAGILSPLKLSFKELIAYLRKSFLSVFGIREGWFPSLRGVVTP